MTTFTDMPLRDIVAIYTLAVFIHLFRSNNTLRALVLLVVSGCVIECVTGKTFVIIAKVAVFCTDASISAFKFTFVAITVSIKPFVVLTETQTDGS
jgi:hypothetical protein